MSLTIHESAILYTVMRNRSTRNKQFYLGKLSTCSRACQQMGEILLKIPTTDPLIPGVLQEVVKYMEWADKLDKVNHNLTKKKKSPQRETSFR